MIRIQIDFLIIYVYSRIERHIADRNKYGRIESAKSKSLVFIHIFPIPLTIFIEHTCLDGVCQCQIDVVALSFAS